MSWKHYAAVVTHRLYIPSALVRISPGKWGGASELWEKAGFWTTTSTWVPSLPPPKTFQCGWRKQKVAVDRPVAALPTGRAGAGDFEHASKHAQTHFLFLLDSVESLVYVTSLATFDHYHEGNSQPSHYHHKSTGNVDTNMATRMSCPNTHPPKTPQKQLD